MRAVDIIDKKRLGMELSKDEIDFFVLGFTGGIVPDYQMAAWLMAVVWHGMSEQETIDLTMTMARSGEVLDLSGVAPVVVDKHSTGGVGDKTTLVVAPLVASLGTVVGKMSGRGLGFSGGTLDKLESVPGFNIHCSPDQFTEQLRDHGIVVAGQSADLAPADGKMYALRDVTATVESLPLIASSIMSKKIAAGAHVIVLDVKLGSGAFMKTEADAVALAETMVRIGRGTGRRLSAVVSDMEQPLGLAVGNALEVREAIDTLQGEGPDDFTEHCLVVAAEMLLLAGRCNTPDEGRAMLWRAIESGQAIAKFREWMRAQGGADEVVDDFALMPQARLVSDLVSPQTGYIKAINAMEVGLAAAALGAGRQRKGDPVDHAVGVVLHKKVGDSVQGDEPLVTLYYSDSSNIDDARRLVEESYLISPVKVDTRVPLILEILQG